MRDELAKRNGLRGLWKATVGGFNERLSHGYVKRMILLVDVRDETGQVVTDHVHFNLEQCWRRFEPGDVVQFEARVDSYWKGYADDRRRDYKLSRPTNIVCIGKPLEAFDDAGQLSLFPASNEEAKIDPAP